MRKYIYILAFCLPLTAITSCSSDDDELDVENNYQEMILQDECKVYNVTSSTAVAEGFIGVGEENVKYIISTGILYDYNEITSPFDSWRVFTSTPVLNRRYVLRLTNLKPNTEYKVYTYARMMKDRDGQYEYYKQAYSIKTSEQTVEAVDMAFKSGVRWASCNLGANSPEVCGNYYAWGETDIKTTYAYTLDNYFDKEYKKYTILSKLSQDDDVAHKNLGGKWRMPTTLELYELKESCEWEWTDNYNNTGVAGYIATSKFNGNKLFFPAAGYYGRSGLTYEGKYGCYWASTNYIREFEAVEMTFDRYNLDADEYSFRYVGRTVRPVCDPE